MTLLHAGRPGDALNPLCRSLQVAVPGESHVRKLYALLAQAYAELGRRETAIRTCQQGIDAFPGDPELLFRRGILEQSLGRPDEAERSFRSLLEAKADRHFSSMDHGILGIKAWHNMAVIYEQQRRHDLAADAWQRVLAYDRTNRIAWRGLVDALASGHDVAGLERVSALAGASDVPPELPILAQARLLCQRGDPQAATAKLEAAFGQSDSTELLYELSELAFRNDFVDAAERALIELTRRCPNDASASQNLGMLHMRRQDYAGAAEWAKRSLEIRPDHAPAQQLLDHAQDRRDLCEKSMAGE
jgi:tetratricopeptide (TPR) repeat protein